MVGSGEEKEPNSIFYNGKTIMSKIKINDKNSSTLFQVLEVNTKIQLRVKCDVSWRGRCWSGNGGLLFFIKNLVELFDSKVCTYKT